jgi:hypothetical protein
VNQYDITRKPLFDFLDDREQYGMSNRHSGWNKYHFLKNSNTVRVIQTLCYPTEFLVENVLDDGIVEFLPRNLHGYTIKETSSGEIASGAMSSASIPVSRFGSWKKKFVQQHIRRINGGNGQDDIISSSNLSDVVKTSQRKDIGFDMTDDVYPMEHLLDKNMNLAEQLFPSNMMIKQYPTTKQLTEPENLSVQETHFLSRVRAEIDID